MPGTRVKCLSCGTVMKSAKSLAAGQSIRCPKCKGVFRVPKDDIDEEERDDEQDAEEEEEEAPRRKDSKWERNFRKKKKKGSKPLGLWLGLGGAAIAVAVVLVIVLGGKGGKDGQDDKDSKVPQDMREGGGSASHTVLKRIETSISLVDPDKRNMIRYLLALSPTPDASVIAIASGIDQRISILNRATGKIVFEFNGKSNQEREKARWFGGPVISPNGKLLLINTGGPQIEIRDVATGNIVKTIGDTTYKHFNAAAFSPNSSTLYTIGHATSDNVMVAWDVATWQQLWQIKHPHNREPRTMWVLPDGKTVLTALMHDDGKTTLDYWDVNQQLVAKSLSLPHRSIGLTGISRDGKMIAFFADNGSEPRTIEVWNLETGRKQCTLNADLGSIFAEVDLKFLPSGNVCLASNMYVATYDPKTGEQKVYWDLEHKLGGRNITSQVICPNGDIVQVFDGTTATILVVRLKE